ncbi:MAG: alpha/beta fold hydrolase [Pseudomonadales bacterium]|nr:alpha/beta fold hydrolase [Pseudomonadales bacterium]MDP7597374.1 alpha/beta fold hydrolase [Pseudomonadales bacterium]
MPETNASGWTIHFENRGEEDAQPLLMVLGLSHRLAHWGRLPALLAERFFVVTFDCRGIGQSEQRDMRYSIDDEVGDMAAVLDAVGLDKVTLYGRSRGGALVQAFTLAYPERVQRLILSGTSHFGPKHVGQSEEVAKAMNFTRDMTREEIFTIQNVAMSSPGWRERDPEAFNACLATDLEAPPRRFAVVNQQVALTGWSSDEALSQIRCPTLVICGEDDGMVPPENSRQLAGGIPNAKFELIAQCGHLPMLEQPDIVARLVTGFIDRT